MAQLRDGINQQDHDDKPYHFGINLGLNRSHFSFTHHPIFMLRDSVMVVESINSTGLNLAWLVNKRLGDHFDLRTYPLNLTFTEKAFEYKLKYPDTPIGEDSITIKKVQSISLSLPIQIKFSSDRIGNFKVYMLGGIKAEYDMAANANSRKKDEFLKFKPMDLGYELGFGLEFYYPNFIFSPEIKLSEGLMNQIYIDKNLPLTNAIDQIRTRSILISIHLEG